MNVRLFAAVLLGATLTGFACAAPASAKRVALVFDDGPKPADVEPLLALLAKEKVTVTFALVGDRVNENPAAAKAVAAAGHEIANHSQRHLPPGSIDDKTLEQEVALAQQAIQGATGVSPKWYWPPFLAIDERVRAAVVRAGITLYEPKNIVVSKDYDKDVPASEIFARATKDVTDGSVILFHEWRTETREQLPAILTELRKQGCEFLAFSALAAATGGGNTATAASAVIAIPEGGDAMVTAKVVNEFATTAIGGNGDAFIFTTVDAKGPGFSRAIRAETKRDLSPAWAVEARTTLGRAAKKGDTGFVHFFARTIASADETGSGQVRVVVQQAGPNYAKSLESTVTMRGEWQEFLMPFTFADDYGKGGLELSFGFGFKRETIEIGGIEVLNFSTKVKPSELPKTRFTYAGREADAAWRKEALARIEKIRKSSFVIEVRDANGQPAAGATIKIEQVRSAFQFGSALQFARLVQESPDNKIYREKALEFFNAASPENDLKWPVWIGEWQGSYSKEQSLQALRWLREKGFHVRGHVLVWPGWKNLPEMIKKLNGSKKQRATIPDLVLAHIADITGATREFIQEWDVLNEPYDNHDLMALFGSDIMVNWFKAAQAGAGPSVPLYLNDYSNHDLLADKPHCQDFIKVAKFLREKGAPLGGLGLQGHIGAQPNPPEHVLATLDVYAEFKLPIRITEFDIDTDDQQLQADYTRDFLILCYSHPSVVGVQHWGFWEKAHWRPRGALFRADWSEKLAAKTYRSLVLNDWRTKVQGKVGKAGKVGGRGFHGDYVVTVERDGKTAQQTFSLKPEEEKTAVQIVLP
ncbi:MAG: endo-1,4-beta-xylanase [Nibricoccus sp.]